MEEYGEAPIEEQFVIRFPPKVASLIRPLVKERAIPPDLEIHVKENTRGCKFQYKQIKLNGTLVDLPCITESLKTIDNKQFYKIADVAQMMIFSDNPQDLKFKDHTSLDGLTYPMRNAKELRFRKRMSKKVIEIVEQEVERLLSQDLLAEDVKYEIHERGEEEMEEEEEEEMDNPEESDAEDDFDLSAIIDKTLEQDTMTQPIEEEDADEDNDNKSSEEEDSEQEVELENDDNDTELVQMIKALKNEITLLESKLQEKQDQCEQMVNVIMKERLRGICVKLSQELEHKREQLNKLENADEEDE